MKRMLILLLCITMLLTSCTGRAPVVERINLSVTEGEADFVFIYNEEAGLDVTDALAGLRKVFREKLNAEHIPAQDDSYEENEDKVEILIGDVNRDTSQKITSNLGKSEYTVGVYDGKLVVAGADEEATVDAINHLYMNYDKIIIDGAVSSENNYTYRCDYPYDNISVGKKDISLYTIVYPDSDGLYAEKKTVEMYAAQRLAEIIGGLCGAIVPCESAKDSEAEYRIEICKGEEKDAYSIKSRGDNILISADSVYAYTRAFDALLAEEKIPSGFSAEGNDIYKEVKNDKFVYVSSYEDRVYGDTPVKSVKIGDTDIREYRIVYHDYGKKYSGHGMNEIYAAQQLQKYLKYAIGTELTLDTDSSDATEHEILIGNTDRTKESTADYGTEDYIIKTEGNNLIITGGEQRGTLYGVYSFLEDHIGCRFYAEDCEVIYKADEIIVPADINKRYSPVLEYRDVDEKAYQNTEIAVKRKINSSFCRSMNYYQGSSVDFAASAFVHTMSTVFDLGIDSRQPCFSDDSNYEKVLTKARQILSTNTNAEILSVTQNDNDNFCGCSKCMNIFKEEGSHAAPMLRFVNRLAEELEDEFPDVKIETLAYMSTNEAPKITKPHKNVIIELCSLDNCCGHPLSDLSCEENENFRRQIADWSAITDNLYIWYYVVEFTGNAKGAPFMNFDSLYDTYTLFYQNGVKGIFNQAYTTVDNTEFSVLRAYLLSKMMWDPNMTRNEYNRAIHEFIEAYYGEAADVIEEYFYMMAAFAHDRHFAQYAALTGILDKNQFDMVSPELKRWMDTISEYEYTYPDVKSHIDLIRQGLYEAKDFADNKL